MFVKDLDFLDFRKKYTTALLIIKNLNSSKEQAFKNIL